MAKTLFILHKYIKCALIENYLHFMKNSIRPHYEKLKPLKSAFIENSNFENNRDPWMMMMAVLISLAAKKGMHKNGNTVIRV